MQRCMTAGWPPGKEKGCSVGWRPTPLGNPSSFSRTCPGCVGEDGGCARTSSGTPLLYTQPLLWHACTTQASSSSSCIAGINLATWLHCTSLAAGHRCLPPHPLKTTCSSQRHACHTNMYGITSILRSPGLLQWTRGLLQRVKVVLSAGDRPATSLPLQQRQQPGPSGGRRPTGTSRHQLYSSWMGPTYFSNWSDKCLGREGFRSTPKMAQNALVVFAHTPNTCCSSPNTSVTTQPGAGDPSISTAVHQAPRRTTRGVWSTSASTLPPHTQQGSMHRIRRHPALWCPPALSLCGGLQHCPGPVSLAATPPPLAIETRQFQLKQKQGGC